MKHSLIFILLLLLSFKSRAQVFKIEGGVTFATVLPNDINIAFDESYAYNLGFNLGAKVAFKISPIFNFTTGLIIDTKGFTREGYDFLALVPGQVDLYKVSIDAALYYVTLPLLIEENYYLKSGSHVFAAIGPYISIGVLGDLKYEILDLKTDRVSYRENDVMWGNTNDDDIKRFDYGIIFNLGFEVSSFQIGASYDLGLENIIAQTNTGASSKNRSFRITLAYVFNSPAKRQMRSYENE